MLGIDIPVTCCKLLFEPWGVGGGTHACGCCVDPFQAKSEIFPSILRLLANTGVVWGFVGVIFAVKKGVLVWEEYSTTVGFNTSGSVTISTL